MIWGISNGMEKRIISIGNYFGDGGLICWVKARTLCSMDEGIQASSVIS